MAIELLYSILIEFIKIIVAARISVNIYKIIVILWTTTTIKRNAGIRIITWLCTQILIVSTTSFFFLFIYKLREQFNCECKKCSRCINGIHMRQLLLWRLYDSYIPHFALWSATTWRNIRFVFIFKAIFHLNIILHCEKNAWIFPVYSIQRCLCYGISTRSFVHSMWTFFVKRN